MPTDIGLQDSFAGDRAALSHRSSSLEKLLEHLLISALGVEMNRRGSHMTVLRDEVDSDGRDLMLTANGVLRPMQCKGTVKGGSRANVDVNLHLASQRSACVLWFDYDPATFGLGPFRWIGGEPGEHMKSPGSRVTRRSTPNGAGEKPVRNGHRRLVKGEFEKVDTIEQLADRLFGPVDGLHAERQRLIDHLILRPASEQRWVEEVRVGRFSQVPERLDEDQASILAGMIDGYQLLGVRTIEEAAQHLEHEISRAEALGGWAGSATALWIVLFLEHRRRRMQDGFDLSAARVTLFQQLEQQLRRQLIILENL